MFKNKKASILDLFYIIVALFGFAIFILIAGMVFPKISDSMINSPLNQSSVAVASFRQIDKVSSMLDYFLLFLFFGLLIAMLVSSYLIESHPIFIPVFVFLLIFAVVIGASISNIYLEYANADQLKESGSIHTFTQNIFEHYVLIIVIVGILSMIITFGKAGLSGGAPI